MDGPVVFEVEEQAVTAGGGQFGVEGDDAGCGVVVIWTRAGPDKRKR